MSISSTSNRNDYTGNDTTATYNYTFRVFLEGDLQVTVRNTTTDVETALTITTDYTVTGVGADAGGTIVLVDAGQDWISASSFLDTGYVMTIRRVVGLTQGTDIRNQGDFFPEVHEDFFDKAIMIDQQQQEDLDRSVKLPETVSSSDFDPELPTDIETADVAIVTNASGNGLAVGPTISAISGAQAEATAAAASASAASASETAAAASAASAAISAAASQWNDVVYITSVDSPVAIVDADSGTLYATDTTGGAITFNLPSISGLTLTSAWAIGIKKTVSSANDITVNRDGTDTIDGGTSVTISREDSGRNFIPDDGGTPDDWTTIEFGEVPIAGDIVGTTDTQVLTNKDIDGGTASNSSRITLPKDTTTNLDLLTDKEATLAYDTTLNSPVINTGSAWSALSNETLTTKGDVAGYDTSPTRIPIGSNGQVLTADSTEALGLKWSSAGGSNSITVLPRQVPTGTLTSAFNTTVFGTETVDSTNSYNTSTGVYTAPVTGYLSCSAQARISYTSASAVFTAVRVINTTTGEYIYQNYVPTGTTTVARFSLSGILAVTLNDTIEVQAYTSGASAAYVNDTDFGTCSASFYILRE